MKYINEDEINAKDLCCKNCIYRGEASLYCYKLEREMTLNQCYQYHCQYLVYRLRFDIQERIKQNESK